MSYFRWFCLDVVETSCSPSSCEMFYLLSESMSKLERSLARNIFEEISVKTASKLNTLLMEELVLKNQFNDNGAKQFQIDITKCLASLFKKYFTSPENHFQTLFEACKLLNLQTGTRIALLETVSSAKDSSKSKLSLRSGTSAQDSGELVSKALKDIGVETLSLDLVLDILNRKICK